MRGLCWLTVALWLALVLGCAPVRRAEPVPYRFREPLAQGSDAWPHRGFVQQRPGRAARSKRGHRLARSSAAPGPGARHSSRASRARLRRLRRRCASQEGKILGGDRTAATLTLLRACLGASLPEGALQGSSVQLRSSAPRPADLVLFHDTRDLNGNGRNDDRFTDAGVVLRVDGPRVRFIYLAPSQRVRVGVLNLQHPHQRRTDGSVVQNTFLRVISPADPGGTRYLAGQLLAGFATWPRPRSGRL